MPTSPSSSAQEARQALGLRLREIRLDAELTGRELAKRAGWGRTKVSKIEHGRQSPTPADITTWCQYCSAADQTADLIATLRAVEGAYVEWRRMQRSGLRQLQASRIPLYKRTRRFRVYEPSLIPGLLQTPEYATALLSSIVEFRQVPNDTNAAVAVRMERQQVLRTGDRRCAFLLEEAALRTRIGGPEVMAHQLAHLLEVASFPSVSLGVIPLRAHRAMWPTEGFWIFDDVQVNIELTSASIAVTQPREITVYARAFEALSALAAIGKGARTVINNALADLEH